MPIVLFVYSIFIFLFFKKILISQTIEVTDNGILLNERNAIKSIEWNKIEGIDYYGRNGFLRMETIRIKIKTITKTFFNLPWSLFQFPRINSNN